MTVKVAIYLYNLPFYGVNYGDPGAALSGVEEWGHKTLSEVETLHSLNNKQKSGNCR
jgi:hypothetical protein